MDVDNGKCRPSEPVVTIPVMALLALGGMSPRNANNKQNRGDRTKKNPIVNAFHLRMLFGIISDPEGID